MLANDPSSSASEVLIDTGKEFLEGVLDVDQTCCGIVVFAHGSHGGRNSPRSRRLAATLRQRSVGTLLVDLLTPPEAAEDAQTPALSHSAEELGARIVGVIRWMQSDPRTRSLQVGLFGGSGGGPAALVAAAATPHNVEAVVSRGGIVHQNAQTLREVLAPTLLIVGENDDPEVLELNRVACSHLEACELSIVPGAGHFFEEPGKLQAVAELAADWFARHFRG